MKTYNKPQKESWSELMQRPAMNQQELNQEVSTILQDVKQKGDTSLIKYASIFDGVDLESIQVSESEIQKASKSISKDLKKAIDIAFQNIQKFHSSQKLKEEAIETSPGVSCWRKSLPIQKVGLYIPGGSAPLFSSILMLGIPAQIAGCEEVILCTPPNSQQDLPDGRLEINPAILYTAQLVGIRKIYKVGGAQAIAAMAYGTESVPQVYKIFGPGNQYVTKAKELVQQDGIAIDMPAGPSEVLIVADKHSNPAFVAADLLSQAEHGADSQVILLSNDEAIIESSIAEVDKQMQELPRLKIIEKSLQNSKAILLNSLEDCMEFSNLYAPEHLILSIENTEKYAGSIQNAGSVFLGKYSCESAGDYASGTNHTLPTNGFARNYSGVSLDSFVKKITFQELTKEGLKEIGPSIEIMAEAEELQAHKNAVTIRLEELNNE
jgi:histidinol dehydrogenase